MLSVVTEALKKSVMFLCVHLSKIFVWYTATGLYITLHNSPPRLDGIHPVEIRLIGIRIIEVFFFFKKIHENFVGTLETVRNREVSVPRGSTEFLTGVRKPIDTNNLLNCVFIFYFLDKMSQILAIRGISPSRRYSR